MINHLICFSLPLFLLLIINNGGIVVSGADEYSRDDFPADFVFGSGTSAYQVEGAAFEDGRTPSIWDTYAHGGYSFGGNGDVACDEYHKYKEDVQLMVDTGLEAYRFSISWSRLVPNGRGPINPKGVEFYNNLINELISHDIQPHVTLHHSDLPQILEDEYGGWINRKSIKDFVKYADVCFREFGDRVLHWTTFNEANVFVLGGYDQAVSPPMHCSSPFGLINCSRGNSSTEPYIAAHNILLAHASAARLYKKTYQAIQHGSIGINIYCFGFAPLTNSTEDIIATQRASDFYIGWFMNPLVFGDYPGIMKKNAGTRIPAFTQLESKLVKGSFDFVGVNHYTTVYIKDKSSNLNVDCRDYAADAAVEQIFDRGDAPPDEFPIKAAGLQMLLEYFKEEYGNPPLYIHENGQLTKRNGTLNDTARVTYLHAYIGSLLESLRNGSNARGYFVWSFLDTYELLFGYEYGFGLYYVDLDDEELRRSPKLSAHWYYNFLKGRSITREVVVQENNASTHSHFSY